MNNVEIIRIISAVLAVIVLLFLIQRRRTKVE
jgi:hypothetical protein